MKKVNTEYYPNRNILSYIKGIIFTGKEIKEWINWHTIYESSKSNIARHLIKYSNNYIITKGNYRSSASHNKFIIIKYKS